MVQVYEGSVIHVKTCASLYHHLTNLHIESLNVNHSSIDEILTSLLTSCSTLSVIKMNIIRNNIHDIVIVVINSMRVIAFLLLKNFTISKN
ncbi:hypothetical protein GW891_00610 [bacterium]|nr:hypothetical protein [bacterium]